MSAPSGICVAAASSSRSCSYLNPGKAFQSVGPSVNEKKFDGIWTLYETL